MKFREVAECFNNIEKESSRLKMTKLLAELFKKATPAEAEIIAYLSLGELHPIYQGKQFNVAEKSLINILASFFAKTSATVKNWLKEYGDIGLVVENHLEQKDTEEELTLNDVYQKLGKVLSFSGGGSVEKKEKGIVELLKSLDAVSAKYLVRIILGKLRLGFSEMTLIDAFSWMEVGDKSLRKDLEHAFNVSADIGLIVKILKEEGIKSIKKIKIIPGVPIRPASAERLANSKAIIKKLGDCVAQPKLDGFRLQVHIFTQDGKKTVRFFSRNLQDMSDMFPDLAKMVLKLKVKDLVVEGEAIAFDQDTNTFLPFQETVKRKRKYDIEAFAHEYPLKLYLFDLLYLDGKSMLDLLHHDRRKKLLKIEKKAPKDAQEVIHVIEEKNIETSQELENYFNENISSGLEGLVVKREDVPYTPGKRNFNWIKLKRGEGGNLTDTIDCVVLGYYLGHGKRAHFGIGAFLVGVLNKKKDAFQTIAKVGTGLSDDGWKELKSKCDKLKVKIKPKNVDCAKDLYPDVWVSPEIVCTVRADEITLSPIHTAGQTDTQNGYALRFPRMIGYREDKSSEDATRVKELDRLFDIQFAKKSKKSRKNIKKTEKVGQTSFFD